MKNKKGSAILFIICVIAIIAFGFIGYKGVVIGDYQVHSFGDVITKGLDLQGGVSVTMEIQDENVSKDDLEKTKKQLELRVNKMGVAETVVVVEGDKRLRVDIPGKYDSSDIVNNLSKTGELTFKSPDGEVILTGSDIKKASVTTNSQTGKPEVALEMNDEGTPKFAEATKKYLGKQISINMDDEQLSNPNVETTITDGKASITNMSSIEEAKNLAGLINAGALPVTMKAASVQTVGSQLGAEALPNAMKAAMIGVGLVFLFMIAYYRIPGFIASLALTLYICLVLFIFGEVGTTLTLPGIAALLLTIGMAVDANVLIFERIKEELKKGVSVQASVNRGFENALSSIMDSNITTILAALVLYFFGSGSVKGFAVTLLIGVIVSLFTALVVTKVLIKLAVRMGLLNKASRFIALGKKEEKIYKIVQKKKIWFAISLAIILVGACFTVGKGLNIGIDFKGGTKVVLDLGSDFNKEEVDKITNKYAVDAVTNTVDGTQYEIKSSEFSTDQLNGLVNELKQKYQLENENVIVSQDEIGASIGSDLTKDTFIALGIAFVVMLAYIAFRFEFKFGVAAIIAILHDLLVTTSIYAIFNITINSPFIAAILTIVGYSINATIVIFDRIRENSKKSRRESVDNLANKSISQTIARSVNTTLTTLFTIVSVYIFVPAVRDFALPIIVGVISGGYSSVFIAPSIWTIIKKYKLKNKKVNTEKVEE